MDKTFFNYDELIKAAQRIENTTPELLSNNRWKKIRGVIKIPSGIWRGLAADEYRTICHDAIDNQSAAKIQALPGYIRRAAQKLKELERLERIDKK